MNYFLGVLCAVCGVVTGYAWKQGDTEAAAQGLVYCILLVVAARLVESDYMNRDEEDDW